MQTFLGRYLLVVTREIMSITALGYGFFTTTFKYLRPNFHILQYCSVQCFLWNLLWSIYFSASSFITSERCSCCFYRCSVDDHFFSRFPFIHRLKRERNLSCAYIKLSKGLWAHSTLKSINGNRIESKRWTAHSGCTSF